MKLSLEDKILLQFGETRKHLQPHEIDADNTDKEIAMANLVKHGYVTAHENGSSRYGRYVSISITSEGNTRQRELLRLLKRSRIERYRDSFKITWGNIHPNGKRITEDIIVAVVSGAICYWLGFITPH